MALFEEIARNGETLGHEDLNCADNSGRVSFKKLFFGKTFNVPPGQSKFVLNLMLSNLFLFIKWSTNHGVHEIGCLH